MLDVLEDLNRRRCLKIPTLVMRDLGPKRSVTSEYMRSEKERREHRIRAKSIRRDVQTDTEEELDERDEDMVDDIVDLLYSRKYGKEAREVDSKPLNADDANYDKKLRREARRQRREAKKAKKERKRAKKEKKKEEEKKKYSGNMEDIEAKMKENIKQKIEDKLEKKVKKIREKSVEIRREKEPSVDRVLIKNSSDSSPDSDSSSQPTDEDDFFDIPSPAEDGEVMDEKMEITEEGFLLRNIFIT